MITWIVYTIRDHEGSVVYVGKTCYPADSRFNAHRLSKKPLGEWIRKRLSRNQDVIVVTEMKWHAQLGTQKERLVEKMAAATERALISKHAKNSRVFFNTQHVRGKHPNVKYIELPAASLADQLLEIEPEEVVKLTTEHC